MKILKNKNLISESLIFTFGTMIYLFSQWLISVMIVRVTGLEDAGYFGLAMSVTSVIYIIASYGIRTYQISDINSCYSDSVYVYSRIITTVLGLIIAIVYSFVMRYNDKQISIIAVYMLFKCCESLYDVYHGIMQKNGKLSTVGVLLVLKGIVNFIAFIIPYMLTKDLTIGLYAMTASAVVMLIVDVFVSHKSVGFDILKAPKMDSILVFLKTTFLVMIIICCNPLFVTIPRIILEKTQGRELLGVYTSLSTPTVLISTFANTAFLQLITKNAEAYENHDKKAIKKMLTIPVAILTVVGAIACILVSLIGHWAFELVYGSVVASYYEYTYGFIISIVLTSILAIFNNFCTGIRKLKQEFIFIAIGCVLCLILSIILIPTYAMLGALYAMIIAQLIELGIMLAFIYKTLKCI